MHTLTYLQRQCKKSRYTCDLNAFKYDPMHILWFQSPTIWSITASCRMQRNWSKLKASAQQALYYLTTILGSEYIENLWRVIAEDGTLRNHHILNAKWYSPKYTQEANPLEANPFLFSVSSTAALCAWWWRDSYTNQPTPFRRFP